MRHLSSIYSLLKEIFLFYFYFNNQVDSLNKLYALDFNVSKNIYMFILVVCFNFNCIFDYIPVQNSRNCWADKSQIAPFFEINPQSVFIRHCF